MSDELQAKLAALEAEATALEDAKARLDQIVSQTQYREDMRTERDRLTSAINDLHFQELNATIADLRQTIIDLQPQPTDGCYTFMEFFVILIQRLGYVRGAQQDYVIGSQTPSDGVREVTLNEIHRWHTADKVPAWAVAQIPLLAYPSIGGTGPGVSRKPQQWTSNEVAFMVDILLNKPTITNKALAEKCTSQFGREISENAIRGMVTRKRMDGQLPPRRPIRNGR